MPYRTDRVALAAPALDDLLQARVRDGRAPTSSAALFTPDGVVATAAATDGTDPPPTPDTAYRVASCTKSLTAATLLSLVEEGVLDLDQPLDATVLGGHRAPTLGELASMAGGIPIDDPWADRQESLSPAAMDALLADGVRLATEPGTRYEYSSFGYAILGRVLERATGLPYPELVRTRLLDPLDLGRIGFDRGIGEPIATGWARVDGGWAPQPWTGPGAFSALGGLIATPTALAGWAGWLAAAWRDGADDRVLSAASRRRMQEPRTPVPGGTSAYGLGLVVERDERHGRIVSHSGGYPGFGAHMRWHPASGIGVVVAENARYSGATVPATRALAVALDAALVPGREPALWPETRAARTVVEGLLRSWDDAALTAIAADNLPLDEDLPRRRAEAEGLRDRVGLGPADPVAPLAETAWSSDSPAHLAWTVPGATGAIRCEVRLTPVRRPAVQTLSLRLG